MYQGYRVIDVHAHAFPEGVAHKAIDFLNGYYHLQMYGSGLAAQLAAKAEEGGVSRVVVFSTATSPKQVRSVNDWIAKTAAENPLFYPLGSLHPDYPDIEGEAERILSLGLHGVKLHPDFQQVAIEDARMARIYKACELRKLPILIHTGDINTNYSKPAQLARVLDDYPSLRVIAAHMGGYSEWEDAMKYLGGKKVWFDTSSTMCCLNNAEMMRLISCYGEDRVLFGTDYPFTAHKEELERFFTLPLTHRQREKILCENTLNFFGMNLPA